MYMVSTSLLPAVWQFLAGGDFFHCSARATPLPDLLAAAAATSLKNRCFCLQVHRSSVQRRVPMRLQVYDIGVWTFKGISGEHPVVVLLPSRLAGRMSAAAVKRSSKALCIEPPPEDGCGPLHELWVDLVNMDTILLDPELLLCAGLGGQGGQGQLAGAGGPQALLPAGAPTAAPSTAGLIADGGMGWAAGGGGVGGGGVGEGDGVVGAAAAGGGTVL